MGGAAGRVNAGFNPGRVVMAPTARVGKPAPDFEASAYVDGHFKNIRLSEYNDNGTGNDYELSVTCLPD